MDQRVIGSVVQINETILPDQSFSLFSADSQQNFVNNHTNRPVEGLSISNTEQTPQIVETVTTPVQTEIIEKEKQVETDQVGDKGGYGTTHGKKVKKGVKRINKIIYSDSDRESDSDSASSSSSSSSSSTSSSSSEEERKKRRNERTKRKGNN